MIHLFDAFMQTLEGIVVEDRAMREYALRLGLGPETIVTREQGPGQTATTVIFLTNKL